MSEHDERIRLQHMLDYAHEVETFTDGKTREDVDSDLILERALRYSIGIIGEAAAQISNKLRTQFPEVNWSDIVGMRNFLFHIYFRVERDILWRTAVESIPELIGQLDLIIQALDRESNDNDDKDRNTDTI
jgi:uncharacterized protein with HEPN domain